MKFTDGYWMTRPEFRMHYAAEIYRVRRVQDELHVLAACKHVANRGDILNEATLEATFSAPIADVIRVEVVHFKGAKDPCVHYAAYTDETRPEIVESDEAFTFSSGKLSAVISKKPGGWNISYQADGRELTSSGYHGMAHACNQQTGRSYMSDSLMLDVGECVYGLGERFAAYVKNGQSIDMWNADGGTASEQAYKNVPFYMTNRGYGIFVDDTSDVSFEVASEKVERVQFSVEGERLAYYVIYGATPKAVLERYTLLTGRPALPPAWSFGMWLTTSFTTDYDEETTSSFIQGMAKRNIPLHVFHFDCFWMKGQNWCDFEWDPDTFPDPEGMLRRYKARGLHICVWINPYIAQQSPLFDEGMSKGYLLRRTDGSVWQTDMWQAGMAIVDVTNPAARRWYGGYLEKLLDMGVDCFKTDFGERIPVRDVVYFDGSSPLHMHNYYTYLYNQMVFEILERKRGRGEATLFARSATAGSQQFPVHWGGDNSANYPSMAETLRAGLSLAHSGFGFWSHDISGFEQTAPADVYKRWCQFGLLSSHSRLHGSSSYRVPWLFDEEACDVLRKFVKLKCALMPYIYAAAVEAHTTGTPVMRPMMLEFPEDLSCDTLDRQYMLGGDLLVAPIFNKEGRAAYYLPAGAWTNILTETVVTGERWIRETYDFMNLPLMARPGSVIPVGACSQKPDYDYADGVTLHAYEMAEGMERTVKIPNLDGRIVATFTLACADGKITVRTDSEKSYHVAIHRGGKVFETKNLHGDTVIG